jgi:hypothetical protein
MPDGACVMVTCQPFAKTAPLSITEPNRIVWTMIVWYASEEELILFSSPLRRARILSCALKGKLLDDYTSSITLDTGEKSIHGTTISLQLISSAGIRSKNHSSMPLADLPAELQLLTLPFVDLRSLVNLTKTNGHFHALPTDQIWETSLHRFAYQNKLFRLVDHNR